MNISEQKTNIILQNTAGQKIDTTHHEIQVKVDSAVIADTVPVKSVLVRHARIITSPVDNTAVSKKSPVAGLSYYDSLRSATPPTNSKKSFFPFIFLEKNRKRASEARISLMKNLREGNELPARPFHDDWIILIILLAAFLFSLINTFSKKFFPEVRKFFLFHGIGETPARDMAGLFHWHSTIINLISFFSMALFGYCATFYFGILPAGISGFATWSIIFGVVIVSVTLRHLICYFTGIMSSNEDLFSEYIIVVYLFFRFSALFLFIVVFLLSYSRIFYPEFLIKTGFVIFGIMFLIRIIRLFLIFIKRNISIFYLILYLCALEFLPVLVLLKYFTGLF